MCAGVVLVGTFLPWVRVGERARSSYALAELLHRLELAPDGMAAGALRWWPTLPLLLVVSLVATWAGRHHVGAGVGTLAGLYAAAIAVTVLWAPVAAEPGVLLSLAGAIGLVAVCGVLVVRAAPPAGADEDARLRSTRPVAAGPASGSPDGRS